MLTPQKSLNGSISRENRTKDFIGHFNLHLFNDFISVETSQELICDFYIAPSSIEECGMERFVPIVT